MVARQLLQASCFLLAALLVLAPVPLYSHSSAPSVEAITRPGSLYGSVSAWSSHLGTGGVGASGVARGLDRWRPNGEGSTMAAFQPTASRPEASRPSSVPARAAAMLALPTPLLALARTNWEPVTADDPGIPSLEVRKWADRASISAGERLTYTIAVTNTGGVTSTMTITDRLPAAIMASRTVTWIVPALSPGAAWTATLPVTVEMSYAGTLTNTVEAATLEGVTGAYTTTTVVVAPPGLNVIKWADRASVQAGEQLTYTVALTNTGGITLTATVTDRLPARVTPTGTITWTPAPLAPGTMWTATVPVTVEMGYLGMLTNSVEVATLEGVTDAYTTTIEVVPTPRLQVRAWAAPDPVVAGWPLSYTIRMTNTGNVDLHAIVYDTLPLQVSPGGVRVWEDLVLAPGEVWTEAFQVSVRPGFVGRLINVVRVETSESVEVACSALSDAIRGYYVHLPVILRAP